MNSNKHISRIKFVLFFFALFLLLFNCTNPSDDLSQYIEAKHYLNHSDTVNYVGMNTCKECHLTIYQTFIRTGMGLSFDTANRKKSLAKIDPDSILFDSNKNLYYQPYWHEDTLWLREYRTDKGIVSYERIEKVNFVIGSGQHTNSHIYLSGNYAYQSPFTYYTQDGLFDFPPGFEDGYNSRFDRKIGLECMSCHNGFPDFVLGSENKYNRIPDGIDCERCHGPGEIHVMLKKKNILVDTSKFIDYSIVNPAKMSLKLQTDLCARCHLQGTMVLKPGKSFYDFKPGMPLSDVMDIFMPLFQGGKEDFIMASHYERFVQSTCYLSSDEGFTCTNCHNPHISTKETSRKKFQDACLTCHPNPDDCSEDMSFRNKINNECVSCHMRMSGTRDIPHVTIHDHKISIPPTTEQLESERIFKGLLPVNNSNTDNLTKARGYLLEYETYHADPNYLDSAYYWLMKDKIENSDYFFNALINYYFLENEFSSIIHEVESKGIQVVLDSFLTVMDYSNYDAWTSYRIGQAYENKGNLLISGYFYKKAIDLAPFNLEFQNKYGSFLLLSGKLADAINVFEFILSEDRKFAPAFVNLAFANLKMNNIAKAKELIFTALKLDPDNEHALINLAEIYLYENNMLETKKTINTLLMINPQHSKALMIRQKITLNENSTMNQIH